MFDLERWARPNERVNTFKLVVFDGAVANTWRTVEVWPNDLEAAVAAAHSRGANIVE